MQNEKIKQDASYLDAVLRISHSLLLISSILSIYFERLHPVK